MNYRDQDLITRMISLDQSLRKVWTPIHDDMNRNYNMLVSSMQWDEESKAKLEAENRPANAYNLLSPVIKHLTSIEHGSRKSIQCVGVGSEDHEKAIFFSRVMHFYLEKAGFDYHKSRAFIDSIISRFGWLYTGWSYEDDPEGELVTRAINPMTVMFELNFNDISLRNANYLEISDELSLDELVMKYAYDNEELQDALIEEASPYYSGDNEGNKKFLSTLMQKMVDAANDYFGTYGTSDDYSRTLRGSQDWFNSVSRKFRAAEVHERRTERRMILFDPRANKKVDITEDVQDDSGLRYENEKIQKVMEQYPDSPEPRVELTKMNWVTTVVPALNLVVANEPYDVDMKDFVYTPVFAWNFHADIGKTQSVIDELLDPQKDFNKRRSTMLEMLQRYVAKGYLVDEKAILGYEEDFENPGIGQVKRIRNGYFDKVKPEEMQVISPDLIRDAQESKMLIEDISVVSRAQKGMGEGEKSGKLFIAKRDQGIQMLQHLFDNLDFSSKQVGRNAVKHIQHYATETRLIRITEDNKNDSQSQPVVINEPTMRIDETGNLIQEIKNDISIGEFDIKISTTPYGETARELEYLKLLDVFELMMQIDPQGAVEILPIVIEASDTPYRSEIVAALQKARGGDPQQQQQQQMMAMFAKMMQEIELEKAKLEAQEIQLENQGQQLENIGKQIDNRGKELDNKKLEQEIKMQIHERAIENVMKAYGSKTKVA